MTQLDIIDEDASKQNNQTEIAQKPTWWKSCNCYQVWPASFKDSNGDGVGDIQGVISKLDYIRELGVDCLWLSPMYASPQVDMGYDISDYEAIHPPYGTMSDMDELIAGCHNRGIRIILDLVVNHTSDEHYWFQESKKSQDNTYADYYIWKDPKFNEEGERCPPNNWSSFFGGPGWTWAPERQQYYLHLFTPQQPDLNWESKIARQAIYKSALKFWFDKGVDGFRCDTAVIYSKDQRFPDGVPDTRTGSDFGNPAPFVVMGPRIHEFWQEIRTELLDHYGDPMMVGEAGGLSIEQMQDLVSSDRKELSMLFDFDFSLVGRAGMGLPHLATRFKLPELKTGFGKTQDILAYPKTWSSVFGENHDLPRSVSRIAHPRSKYHDRAAKVVAMLLATLSGTLFLYQGQEIGMTNIPESWSIDDLKDVAAISYWKDIEKKHPGDKEMLRKAWLGIVAVGRDNARTPVQWSNEPHAGFTTGTPWMRVNDNYKEINAEDQQHTQNSILSMWKDLLKLRQEHSDILVKGSYHVVDYDNEKTFTFQKMSAAGRTSVTVLNFSEEEGEVRLPKLDSGGDLEMVISNIPRSETKLAAWEGRIYIERV